MSKSKSKTMQPKLSKSAVRSYEVGQEIIALVIAAAWLAFFPLANGGTFTAITYHKWVWMAVLTGVSVFGAAVYIAFDVAQGKKLRKPTLELWLLLGFIAFTTFSAFFGVDANVYTQDDKRVTLHGMLRYEGLYTQLCYLAIFVSLYFMRVNTRKVAIAAAIGMVLHFGVFLLQYIGLNPFALFPEGLSLRTDPGWGFFGTVGNVDMIGCIVSVLVPFLCCAWLLHDGGKKAWNAVLVAGIVCGILYLFVIDVDAAVIGMAAWLLIMFGIMLHLPQARWKGCIVTAVTLLGFALNKLTGKPYWWYTWNNGINNSYKEIIHLPKFGWMEESTLIAPSKTTWILLGAAAVLVLLAILLKKYPCKGISVKAAVAVCVCLVLVALGVLYVLPVSQADGTVWEIQEILHGRPQPQFGTLRVGVWMTTLEMLRDPEILFKGIGPDTFMEMFHLYYDALGHNYLTTEQYDNPHNMFLAILVQNGLPALLCFVGAAAVMAIKALRRKGNPYLPFAVGALCYLVQGFFSFSICLSAPVFWAAYGIACEAWEE